MSIPTGPIETEPIDYPSPGVFPSATVREGILRDAFRTAGVELGAYDERIARWLSETADWSTFAVMASWVARAAASSRANALNEQGPDDQETLEEAAQMYRHLRPVIERTMTDPDRWDGDEDEAFHLGRYVEWLAAERSETAAEVLTQAADEMDAHCEQYGVFGVGDRLRRMAGEKSSRQADATPDKASAREARLAQLLDAIRSRPGKWTTGLVQGVRRATGGPVQRGTARRDLEELHRRGHLAKHGAGDGRYYTLRRREEPR